MLTQNPWVESDVINGCITIEVTSWKNFMAYVNDNLIDYREYIWRGQASAEWKLEPSLDRLLRKQNKLHDKYIRKIHLEKFQLATRGRRGNNPPLIENENYWWALGQHHGLATPLLDWTTSPYVAAYFAFWDETNQGDERAIYALSSAAVHLGYSNNIKIRTDVDGIDLIEPLTDENPRLVNQGGLFTKSPDGVDIGTWVKEKFKGEYNEYILIKFILPNTERDVCLRTLNRMNINHLTLFPDLFGASEFCNLILKVKDY